MKKVLNAGWALTLAVALLPAIGAAEDKGATPATPATPAAVAPATPATPATPAAPAAKTAKSKKAEHKKAAVKHAHKAKAVKKTADKK